MQIESVVIPAMRWVVNRPRVADAMFRLDPWGSPFSDAFVDDPMVLADEIRASGPVTWRRLYQQWFVSGYDEAREMLASPHTGTSNQIRVILGITPYTKLTERSRTFFAHLLLGTDPPQHTRLRSLVNRAFTPRQVARLDDRMQAILDGLLAELDSDRIELMHDLALSFPSSVIAELFGLPETDWPWLRRVSATIAQLTDPIRSFDPAEMDATIADFHERILALAEERRAEPANDLLTGLVSAQADDGDRLSDDELVAMAGIILIAGHETTAGMIGMGLIHLAEHPDQLALLRERPELWPNAVEELLRWDTAVRSVPRAALEDFEFRGHRIKKGQNIVILPQMANRDPRRAVDADTFRVDRDELPPLSFGHGIHYCVGANLARAELNLALPALVEHLGDYRLDRSEVEWSPSIVLRRPERVPITPGTAS